MKLVVLLFSVCSLTFTVRGEVTQTERLEDTPTGCELNTLYIDEAIAGLTPKAPKLIAIARLGDGESASVWNERRLFNLQTYVKMFRRVKVELVVAEGERMAGLGGIELYVEGNLFRTLKVRQNKDFPVGTCVDDKRNCVFYPWRDRQGPGPCWPG